MSDPKLADITKLEEELTNIADAIRAKNGATNKYTLDQMPMAILNIPLSEGHLTYDDIATGGPEEEVYLTSWPYQYSFSRRNITKVSGTITSSDSYAFSECQKLTEVDLPNFTGGNNFAVFSYCPLLKTVKLPKLKQISSYYFREDFELENVALPSLQQTCQQMFQSCSKLEGFDFLGLSNKAVLRTTWRNCPNFNTLIIRGNYVVPLENINALESTPFSLNKAGGTLYVPQAQIENYKIATNWSVFFGDEREEGYLNNKILPIEGSIYEIQYVDGTEIV